MRSHPGCGAVIEHDVAGRPERLLDTRPGGHEHIACSVFNFCVVNGLLGQVIHLGLRHVRVSEGRVDCILVEGADHVALGVIPRGINLPRTSAVAGRVDRVCVRVDVTQRGVLHVRSRNVFAYEGIHGMVRAEYGVTVDWDLSVKLRRAVGLFHPCLHTRT